MRKPYKPGCHWDVPWVGQCGKEFADNSVYCEQHEGKECCICKKQATHGCDTTLGPLVCGYALCDDVECYIQHVEQHHGSFDIRTKAAQDSVRERNPEMADAWADEWNREKEYLRSEQTT